MHNCAGHVQQLYSNSVYGTGEKHLKPKFTDVKFELSWSVFLLYMMYVSG